MTRGFVTTLTLGLSITTSALGQVVAPAPAPASPAPAPASTTPQPTAPPAAAPSTAPPRVDVPPGYMLVPIRDPASATRYDVQYPQARGALPPGMELPYEDGDAIPAGYRVREQARRGLVIGGSIMTGVPWVF